MAQDRGDIFVHPTALVETDQIGNGTRVWAFTHLMHGARIGERCNIGSHSFIEAGVVIGNNVTIKNGNMIWDGVVLEDGVFVGPQVVFTNDRYPRSPRLPAAAQRYSDRRWLVPTRVCTGAALGAGAVILAGHTVGAYATVAAGAVVTRRIPAYALVAGTPARLQGWVCQCGRPLVLQEQRGSCDACQRSYVRQDAGLVPTGEY